MRSTRHTTLQETTHPFLNNALRRFPRWRVGLLCAGLAVLLGSALIVHAQAGNGDSAAGEKAAPVLRTITAQSKVAVRSGSSEKYYATGYLNPGDKVVVVGETKNGWLEIKPPAGSFSYINALLVKRYGRSIAAVNADNPIPTRIGSDFVNDKEKIPNVENKRRLERGTLLIVLEEKPIAADDGSWFAIAPTPGEVRYIPASAVAGSEAEALPNAIFVRSGGQSGTHIAGRTSMPTDLIAQADHAFQSNQWCRATQLYLDAAQRTTNYTEKVYCYNQLDKLEKVGGGPTACRVQPGHPQHSTTRHSTNPFQVASHQVTNYQESGGRNQGAGVRGPGAGVSESALNTAPNWSRWGVLRRTNFRHTNGQPIYALTDGRGNTFSYAVTTPEMTLEPYLGKQICLFGKTEYHSDRYFRNNYVMVSYVALP